MRPQQLAEGAEQAGGQQPQPVDAVRPAPHEQRRQQRHRHPERVGVEHHRVGGVDPRQLLDLDRDQGAHHRGQYRHQGAGAERGGAGAHDQQHPDEAAQHRQPAPQAHRLAQPQGGGQGREQRGGVGQRDRLRQRQMPDRPEPGQHRHQADRGAQQVTRQLRGAWQWPARAQQHRQQEQQAEQVAEEGDLQRGQLRRRQPDRHHHQSEGHGAGQHQQRRAQRRGRGYHCAPTMRGSGSRMTPKRSPTEAVMRRASASSSAPLAWPWLTSTSACAADTPASPSR
ncbi:hypothetical protein NB689_003312 [Xanthomonas sacchari]|nr:hypothetical protein [Xanthomonas sacchari]